MKITKVVGLLTFVTGAAFVLTACNNNKNTNEKTVNTAALPKVVTNKRDIKKGGTYKIGISSNTPFAGVFLSELSNDSIDTEVSYPGNEELFKCDDSYTIVDGGAANLALDYKQNTATITINPKVKWSDGSPLVAKDLVYSYKIIANKDSGSARYTDSLQNIVGLEDYHAGKTNTVTGLKTPDGGNGRKLVIQFTKMTPAMKQQGSGYILSNAAPYHYLKDIPLAKLATSDQVRKKPLFFGPYKLTKITPGEVTEWAPNKYYYQGTPNFNKVIISIINPGNVATAIKSNRFDQISVPNAEYKNVKNAKNTEFIADTGLSYSYMAFKVGKWDAVKGENVMNKKAKMANRSLRRAMAYAMNIDEVYQKFSNGLSFRIPTLILQKYGKFFNKDEQGFPYNLKKANQILDQAGYKKKGKFRQTPDGKDLVINFAAMSGEKHQEAIIRNYIKQWAKIGLNVHLVSDKLIEFNSFYDRIQNDDASIDVFIAAWSLTGEPSPNDLYNRKAPFNFSRFVGQTNDQLLEAIDSDKSFNTNYRKEQFDKWQTYMNKEAYVVPISSSYEITAVNDRVVGLSTTPSSDFFDVGFSN